AAHIPFSDQAVIVPADLKLVPGAVFQFKGDEILGVDTAVIMAVVMDRTRMMCVVATGGPDMGPLAYDPCPFNQYRLPVVGHPSRQAFDSHGHEHADDK